jgi:hypothetical protein
MKKFEFFMNSKRSNINNIFFILFLIFFSIFNLSYYYLGNYWDVQTDFNKHKLYFDLFIDLDISKLSIEFLSSIGLDYEINYGILYFFPSLFISKILKEIFFFSKLQQFDFFLYSLTFQIFISSFFIFYLFFKICVKFEISYTKSLIYSLFFYTYPVWYGNSLFNYKDIFFSFFYFLSFYSAISFCLSKKNIDNYKKYLYFLSLATLGASLLKLISIVFFFTGWFFFFIYAFQFKDGLKILVINVFLLFLGIYLFTPVAWFDPINYIIYNFKFFSILPWNECTIIFGKCLGINEKLTEDWSVLFYLSSWFLIQLPEIILIALPLIIYFFIFNKNNIFRLIIFFLLFPIILITIKNSLLTDGIRQLLFIIPIIFFIMIYFVEKIKFNKKITNVFFLLIFVSFLVNLITNIRLFPYNYSYFNVFFSSKIKPSFAEIDPMGVSLKEAAEFLNFNKKEYFGIDIITRPSHLIDNFLDAGFKIIKKDKINKEFIYVNLSRNNFGFPSDNQNWLYEKIDTLLGPFDCKKIYSVERSLLFFENKLEFARISRCKLNYDNKN